MAFKDTIKNYEWVLIPLLLIVVAFFGGDYYGQRKVENSLVSEKDTVYTKVTVYKDFPDPIASAAVGFIPIPKYMFLTDTINVPLPVPVPGPTDTQYVYLPREQKYYEEDEGRLRLWVSGYDPRLDRYELDERTITITNTVTVMPPKFTLGISGGFGAMFPDKSANYFPYLELDAAYSVNKWFGFDISGGYEAPIAGGKITPSPFVKISGRLTFLRF